MSFAKPPYKIATAEKKKKGLTTNEVITIVISSFALFIAVLSFYYGTFNVDDNLRVRVIDQNVRILVDSPRHEDKVGNVDSHCGYEIRLVFTNAGNRQAMIFKPEFHISKDSLLNGSNCPYTSNIDLFPFILDSHCMKMMSFYIEPKELAGNFKRGALYEYDSSFRAELSGFYFKILFHSIDSKGIGYIAQSSAFSFVLVDNKKGLRDMAPATYFFNPLISLFQNNAPADWHPY
jgi:hypothetical protein